MSDVDCESVESIDAGALDVSNRYAKGGSEELSPAPGLFWDAAGRLMYCFRNGRVLVKGPFGAPPDIRAVAPK